MARKHVTAAAGQDTGARAGVPHGFVPVEEVRSLPLMGRWTALRDGMPPWLPFQALLEMARREQEGDDAARAWLETYRHAVQGEPASQRAMGAACEGAQSGLAPDLDRACFWYHRAGLAGDEDASGRVLAVRAAHEIDGAAFEEPSLVYPGQWRLTRERPGGVERIVLELRGDGCLAGVGTNGLWSYDRAGRVLTLAHRETWRVRIVACREAALFGREAGGTGCLIDRFGPLQARPE